MSAFSGTLREADLTELWAGQRFPAGALVTRQGVIVRVISPGRRGRGPGPDFRGAVIGGPSGQPLAGDVELHVRASSFRAHGHEGDPAYTGIVLHVVFEDDANEDTLLPGGGRAPVVALAPWVARRKDELRRWLERPPLLREPCADALDRMGTDAVAAALDAEGQRRFDARVAVLALAGAADGADQAVYAALLEALGYGGNAKPMRALAMLLPWQELARQAAGTEPCASTLLSLLLACAGSAPPSPPPITWKRGGVRPKNAPARRLAAAAALLARYKTPARLLALASAPGPRDLIGALSIADPACGEALVGRSRALEIAVNVVLPAAAAFGDCVLASQARALFAGLPRPAAYGATRFLERTLAVNGGPRLNARRAQGLLALHKDWCTQNGCGRCPLS